MKRILCLLTVLCVTAGYISADEGMWMLPLLNKMNSKQIKEAGCELNPNQIYKAGKGSLKDAIIQFGGGCTGEIVSEEGLLLTNHHCGYRYIQQLSTVDHDYLKDGFWAMKNSEELPCEGMTVEFLQYMEDITPLLKKAETRALKAYKDSTNAQEFVDKAVADEIEQLIAKAEKRNPFCKVEVESFYNNNAHYLIVSKVYKDIRFVGAPPSSIGKFGADSDNWMWPRHTGDFSIFRVYADKNNNPAEYSPENVPLNVKNPLKISLKGIEEGDFTMIMGYPGRTTRFQTSPELKFQIAQNDIRIEARTIRQDVLLKDMLADPKIKIQYASKYSSSSNGWKKWQGMKKAFEKLDIIGRAQEEEKEFKKWVNSDPKGLRSAKYGSVLDDLEKAINSGMQSNLAYTKAAESIYRIEITNVASMLGRSFNEELKTNADSTAALMAAYKKILPFYKDYSVSTDKKVSKAMIEYYRSHAKPEDYPTGLEADFATMDVDAFVEDLFANSCFCNEDDLKKAIESYGTGIFSDPAYIAAWAFTNKTYDLFMEGKAADRKLSEARKLYTEGLLEWKKGEPSYPDANFTMRFTYGSVKGYSPKDAVVYSHYTTLKGVMEKENPESWEFIVPAKLKELWEAQDFGNYAMADGQMPVAFLSNNDITGGNSGSPIMNAKGELIGLAFDGNWESMSSDVMFEPELQRCINVDIRYVLFIVDKFGGAGWLLDEMNIVK